MRSEYEATGYGHCPKCGQATIGGQFTCGHSAAVLAHAQRPAPAQQADTVIYVDDGVPAFAPRTVNQAQPPAPVDDVVERTYSEAQIEAALNAIAVVVPRGMSSSRPFINLVLARLKGEKEPPQ